MQIPNNDITIENAEFTNQLDNSSLNVKKVFIIF